MPGHPRCQCLTFLSSISALPPVMVPRSTEIPSKLPELENYATTVPENTDFPLGLSENISIPGKYMPQCCLLFVYLFQSLAFKCPEG